MASSEKEVWIVRAGVDNELINQFKEKGVVAVGWTKIGDISDLQSQEELKKRYDEVYDRAENRRNLDAGQLRTFAHKIEEGDLVLTYDKSKREYHIGRVKSDYKWEPDQVPEDYPHVRSVEWIDKFSRDRFSTPAKNSLGSTLTVFSLNQHKQEVKDLLQGDETTSQAEEEETPPYYEEVSGKAEELISDQISQLDYRQFEELVSAVLEGMGFKAKVASKGPDRGVDIRAHPDDLGFENPVIKAQVKHRQSSVGGPQMREFLTTVKDGEKGLYVSTGGYTNDAISEKRESSKRVTLLDRDEFIQILLDNYDNIAPEYQAIIPLKKVYLPAPE